MNPADSIYSLIDTGIVGLDLQTSAKLAGLILLEHGEVFTLLGQGLEAAITLLASKAHADTSPVSIHLGKANGF